MREVFVEMLMLLSTLLLLSLICTFTNVIELPSEISDALCG
jgi:hypothetical protein